MNDVYEIYNDIIGYRFALVSEFFKSQKGNVEELVNIRKHLLNIQKLEKAMRNHESIDHETLAAVKQYVMGTKPEYHAKTK